jgi:FkbM family methyltransferase
MLVVKDKVVVDIGAYSGDSAIYFSFKGAKKVIAFEPFPFAYTIAKKNIELNKITNIELLNEAIGLEDGNVFLDSEAKGPSATLKQEGRANVKMRSLSSLVEQFNLSNASLKMDCEGSEVCLLEFSAKVINAFDQIILEYHDEGYEQLNKKLLCCGYKTLFFDVNGKLTQSPHSRNGLIYASL